MNTSCSLVACLFLTTSCTFTCQEVRNTYFLGKKCNVVIKRNTSAPRNIDVAGYNPLTGQVETYQAGGGIYIELIKAIALNDTLWKESTSDFFLLKKKGITLKFGLQCSANKEFAGVSQDTLSKSVSANDMR
ncbi:MAG: hypothetical protein ACRYGH_12015 [Janthinobacterium lividum]